MVGGNFCWACAFFFGRTSDPRRFLLSFCFRGLLLAFRSFLFVRRWQENKFLIYVFYVGLAHLFLELGFRGFLLGSGVSFFVRAVAVGKTFCLAREVNLFI